MPPKKGSAKAEKKREEAERRAKEEAEAAEAAERERIEREEREAAEREELERLKAEEEAHFVAETARINEVLEQQREVLEKWKTTHWQQKQWSDYTSCRVLPDPSNVRAFNTYLSLCEDDSDQGEPNIQASLAKLQDYFQLYSEVEDLLHADGLPQPSEADVTRYNATLPRLHKLSLTQLDRATLQYMQEAEKHVDMETYNMRVEASVPQGVIFCLWGNVVKNPRLKSLSFQDELEFTLDLPKPILLADVALRVIQLPFDHLSPLSQSFACKRSPPATGVSTVSKASAKSENGENPAHQGEDKEGAEGTKEAANSPDKPGTAESKVDSSSFSPDADAENKEDSGDPQDQPDDEDDTVAEGNNGERDDDGHNVDNESDCDDGELEPDEVNLRAFLPACGPILFDLLEMPPQPKSVNNWTFRKIVASHLVPYKYPAEVPRPPPLAGDEESVSAPPAPTPGSSAWPPIVVSMQLPAKFVFTEEPQLAQWDGEKWRSSGFKEVNYDLEGKTISFQTFYFRPLALMVDRYSNMPYVSWSMLPAGVNHTILTLEGAAIKVTIEIKEHHSTLVRPTEITALDHILNKPLSSRQLMQVLSSAGANFFPVLDADKYVSVTTKHHMIEMSVYQSMAMACCGVGFQWSRWNSEVDKQNIVLRAVPTQVTSATQEIDQLDWCTYLCGRRNYRVALNEDSAEFCDTKSEGCNVHPSLYSALDHEASSQIKETMKATSPMHCEAVKHWLTAVKMLTFS